ncbi:hypothetical protein WSK_1684 [Novosphingobium sp. Rr 2-17]|uniref:hypothetical protein n=1 Tax=Novosphingobium sp. Rr 2-17 TaxID=555793 RepID=UPI000269A1C3|nr:hypothetical protein [Novosphingobium sp. Rr 2-17]EIZ79707.1 hypothetical protein WSK_1684 [Novosphingobium sp. Rr 2-17]
MLLTNLRLAALLGATALALNPLPTIAQTIIPPGIPPASAGFQPLYADLVDLVDSAPLVVQVQIAKTTRVEDARAPGLTPGSGRFFVEAKTRALLTGNTVLGESVRYLVDLPLDARGKPAKLKKQDVFLFARPVPGDGSQLQLVNPRAQVAWSPAMEARLRTIIKDVLSPDAPARVTGVRELLYVPGNLAGQGETQIFLNTRNGSAASITVRHQPGAPPQWGASFSELVADVGHPPLPETLEWYRLACFLPNTPPPTANVSETDVDRAQALADYSTVIGGLGPCERALR